MILDKLSLEWKGAIVTGEGTGLGISRRLKAFGHVLLVSRVLVDTALLSPSPDSHFLSR